MASFGNVSTWTQPYAAALEERMGKLGAEETPCHTTVSTFMVSLSLCQDMLLGTSLTGDELVRTQCPEQPISVADVISLVAEALSIDTRMLALFEGDRVLSCSDEIADLNGIVGKIEQVEPTIFVCSKSGDQAREQRLGDGSVDLRLPDTVYFQALQEVRHFVTMQEGGCWVAYSKKEVSMCAIRSDDESDDEEGEPIIPFSIVGLFPRAPRWPLPQGWRQWGGSRCDVFSAIVDIPAVRPLLDEHAMLTSDRPIPRYQMIVDPNQFVHERDSQAVWVPREFDVSSDGIAPIVDPNQFVHERDSQAVWVPCEFDVSSDGIASLVGGERSHDQPHLARKVAMPVLQAALPLLARLQRPRLLLDQRRLQVVFKAQKIILPPCVSENADSEYIGLWHVDGRLEHVVAVVLYYYKVDAALCGGDMEFCGREALDVLGYGDCDNNASDLSKDRLREAFRKNDVALGTMRAQSCRVPIVENTVLVFSNYQMVHRVLRMVNKRSDAEASRDFVALFIIDPSVQPLVPARCHLARSYIIRRTLKVDDCLVSVDSAVIQSILEFMGVVPTTAQKRKRRDTLLLEQLQPQGEFAGSRKVYATGNGCYTMIGWLSHLLGDVPKVDDYLIDKVCASGWKAFTAMNDAPKKLDRGMSEAWSLSSSEKERRTKYEQRRAEQRAEAEARAAARKKNEESEPWEEAEEAFTGDLFD